MRKREMMEVQMEMVTAMGIVKKGIVNEAEMALEMGEKLKLKSSKGIGKNEKQRPEMGVKLSIKWAVEMGIELINKVQT